MPFQSFLVDQKDEGERLDLYLSGTGVWPSRSFVQKIIESGGVRLANQVLKASYKVIVDQLIEVFWDEPKPLELIPEAIPVEILYEDGDLIVVNKPRGMVVHPANGNHQGTLVNALLEHCQDLSGIGGIIRPGIVHRLDKDTSGVLVVAKNDLAHLSLAAQLKARTMKRVYQAIVHGKPPQQGRIEGAIGRHPLERKKMAVIATGKPAVTNYQVLEYMGIYTHLEARLESGRTHQIRVHFSYLGYPLLGDPVYGRKKETAPILGQALHAVTLGFIHPRSQEYLEFNTPLSQVMQELLFWCHKD